MKRDDMSGKVSDTGNNGVKRTDRKKRSALYAAVAAVLVLAVAAGSFAAWRYTGRDDEALGKTGDVNAAALVSALYPAREKYPRTENGWEFDDEQFDRWRNGARARQLTDEETDGMRGYFSAVLPKLLASEDGENAVCSPVNLYIALSMLSEVTGGQSRAQILELLGSESVEEQRRLTNRVWNAVYNDDGTYTSLLANSLWLRDDGAVEYDRRTLETLAEDYYASSFSGEMGSEEFNGLLRDWMNGQTGGLLEEQTGELSFDDRTVLAIASTALFGDRWAVEFDPEKTGPQVFHAGSGDLEREFLHRTVEGTYYWGDKFSAVVLSFETGGSMRLLLPDEGVEMKEILADAGAVGFLTGSGVPQELGRRDMKINLALPKFDVSGERDLCGAIRDLGVTDVLDPDTADLTPLLGEDCVYEAYVSQILHGARVKVDEEGCEAAAYTLIIMDGAGAPQEKQDEIDLTLDRPFVFSLMSGDVPMFAGVVNEP